MGYRSKARSGSWTPSMTAYLPKRNPNHIVEARSGLWTFYSGKTQARAFTMCAFCTKPQVETNAGWCYRKHFNTGMTMTGPVTQHACPTCAKDPKKVVPALIKVVPAPSVMVTSGRRGQRRGGP